MMLETERLILRPLTTTDAPLFQTLVSAREIADTMIAIPYPYPEGEAAKYVAKQITEFKAGQSFAFAIALKSEQSFCGVIEIRAIEQEHSQAELSFWLAPRVWGQGYMSEALNPVLQFSFEALKLNRLYAHHMVRNPGSGKVLQKNGFLEEGILRQRVYKWGVFEDVKLWAILRKEWSSRSSFY